MAKVCDQLHSTTNLGKLDSMSNNIKKHGPAQAAEQLGIHADTLRRWEKEGTITPPTRTAGGHRRYSDNDIAEIQRQINAAPKVWK